MNKFGIKTKIVNCSFTFTEKAKSILEEKDYLNINHFGSNFVIRPTDGNFVLKFTDEYVAITKMVTLFELNRESFNGFSIEVS